mmetsp:Transcript_30057/g.49666  ORF Transcript_30057/g.49666 Transcript_30057/m.49666 type:complete len:347 (-) Transcript_30057:200-1240(-)|eukprot:CAMPEP_0119016512 /NCGR_PEP_ID=MMETSP1176-20130426/13351_1 /TAXON_ID=265551 /ORGANISM="Synedropsis recta cf, Strain CCMP1620" /LENGTH=346 /DNA_ID=CAMNT_0006969959 /DNA_START=138 /DNA_END=1178 /DNA_ORIENTATION=-
MTWTVLHDACEHQDAETVLARTKVNADEAYCRDAHDSTPLHIACWSNPPLEVVRVLIEAYPHALRTKDVHGDTPLHIAVSNPVTSIELVQILVEACPQAASIANREGLMPLHAACRYSPSNEETICLLLETHQPAAKARIKMGDLVPRRTPHTEFDLKDPDFEGAADRSSFGSIDLRFEALGVQTRDGTYPLHMAVSNHAPLRVLDMLINSAPDVVHLTNKFGEAPLHLALRSRAIMDEVIELLLHSDEMAVVLEMPERRGGNLPLHLAVQSECSLSIIVQLLTRFQHAVRVPNNAGKLPMALVKGGSEDLLDILAVSDEADCQEGVDDFDECEVESSASDLDPLW